MSLVDSGNTPMTGQQMMDALALLTVEQRALPIQVEGCDCWGWAGEVAVEPERRINSWYSPPHLAVSRTRASAKGL